MAISLFICGVLCYFKNLSCVPCSWIYSYPFHLSNINHTSVWTLTTAITIPVHLTSDRPKSSQNCFISILPLFFFSFTGAYAYTRAYFTMPILLVIHTSLTSNHPTTASHFHINTPHTTSFQTGFHLQPTQLIFPPWNYHFSPLFLTYTIHIEASNPNH